jgi:outer membrane lipopolysaccharide assembly protein LptE/RlpB
VVNRRTVLASLSLLALGAIPGCGYSLSGRGSFLPEYIKKIGVPQFTNNTTVFDIDRRVSERVRAELLGRGKYNVVQDTTGVDALLTGEISSITIAPAALTQQQQASRYALTLVAKIEFKDVKANKVIWSNPSMQFREEYDVTIGDVPDPNAFLGQDVNAQERLATAFARSIVSAILEAF